MKKFLVVSLIASLLCCFDFSAFASDDAGGDYIALHIGSPLVLSGESMKALDSDNPNVVPVIHKDRTLVPLRAVSEHFGASVAYNAMDREASIAFGGRTFFFPIDESYYRIEEAGQAQRIVPFDTEALIMQNRTLVPLRVICEDVLGKTVGYSDGVITVGDTETDLDDAMVEGIKNRIGQALKVSSRDELNRIVEAMSEYREMKAMDEMLAPDGI